MCRGRYGTVIAESFSRMLKKPANTKKVEAKAKVEIKRG
jgi:hypothetical protein